MGRSDGALVYDVHEEVIKVFNYKWVESSVIKVWTDTLTNTNTKSQEIKEKKPSVQSCWTISRYTWALTLRQNAQSALWFNITPDSLGINLKAKWQESAYAIFKIKCITVTVS